MTEIVAIVCVFGFIPLGLFGLVYGIYKIVASVQRRRIAEAYAKEGIVLPEEKKEPKKMSDVVVVRALALVGVAIGLGLGYLFGDQDMVIVALTIGFGGLGMLGGWFIVRRLQPKDHSQIRGE